MKSPKSMDQTHTLWKNHHSTFIRRLKTVFESLPEEEWTAVEDNVVGSALLCWTDTNKVNAGGVSVVFLKLRPPDMVRTNEHSLLKTRDGCCAYVWAKETKAEQTLWSRGSLWTQEVIRILGSVPSDPVDRSLTGRKRPSNTHTHTDTALQ